MSVDVSVEILRDELKRFLGLQPYDEPSNITRGDPYYAMHLERKYGKTMAELKQIAGLG